MKIIEYVNIVARVCLQKTEINLQCVFHILLHYDLYAVMSILSLCDASYFIDALVKNGYCDTLSSLLHNLDIPESAFDIVELLTTHRNTNIDTERTIMICDELCVSRTINYTITHRKLDRLSDQHIINWNDDEMDYIDTYNRGYKIIPQGYHPVYALNALINNAHNNGLYVPYIRLYNYSYNNIAQYVLNDARKITVDCTSLLSVCKNAEEISIICYDKDKFDNKCLFPARNIKILTMKVAARYKLTNRFLKQFTQLHTLNISYVDINCFGELPPTLRVLRTNGTFFNNNEIKPCVYLKVLCASDTQSIKTCDSFAKSLIKLDAYCMCGITDSELRMCNRLKILHAAHNKKITTCIPFARTLRQLDASGSSGINDDGLLTCNRLKILNAADNPKITTCAPFAKSLKILYAGYSCGIGDDGIISCTNIRTLHADNNPKISPHHHKRAKK